MSQPIIVVSGLPRSGTSMMMQILEAASIPLLCDGVRAADEDNLRGYYEYEPVKAVATDPAWLVQARGKAVKIVSPLLRHLPATERYRVVFMRRHLGEVLASQAAMMRRRGEADELSDRELRVVYETHLTDVRRWLRHQVGFEVLDIDYRALVTSGSGLEALEPWLTPGTDVAELARRIDPHLYRQRG